MKQKNIISIKQNKKILENVFTAFKRGMAKIMALLAKPNTTA